MDNGKTPLNPAHTDTSRGETLKRVFSGFFLIPVIVVIVLYATLFWLFAVAFLVTLLALWEYNKITALEQGVATSGVFYVLLGSLAPVLFYLGGAGSIPPYLIAVVLVFFSSSMIAFRDTKDALKDASIKLMGVIYIALPLSHAIALKELEVGSWWLLFLLIVIWCNDTFAYYVGRGFGAHKLTPVISPNKTVEGAAGGITGGVLAALVFNWVFTMGLGAVMLVFLAILLGAVGILGDLIESLIKRGAGVKDSGSIIPGHGGILDRIDSLIFAIPVTYYFVLWQT